MFETSGIEVDITVFDLLWVFWVLGREMVFDSCYQIWNTICIFDTYENLTIFKFEIKFMQICEYFDWFEALKNWIHGAIIWEVSFQEERLAHDRQYSPFQEPDVHGIFYSCLLILIVPINAHSHHEVIPGQTIEFLVAHWA